MKRASSVLAILAGVGLVTAVALVVGQMTRNTVAPEVRSAAEVAVPVLVQDVRAINEAVYLGADLPAGRSWLAGSVLEAGALAAMDAQLARERSVAEALNASGLTVDRVAVRQSSDVAFARHRNGTVSATVDLDIQHRYMPGGVDSEGIVPYELVLDATTGAVRDVVVHDLEYYQPGSGS